MSRAEATKARILAAATAEFAAHGIAGARVERIAKTASANKNLIYVYFESKDLLFDAVFDAHVARGLEQVPFTAEDLPGYAGRIHDYCREHPEVLRLAAWHRLERGAEGDPSVAAPAYAAKLDSLATAQREGHLAATFAPATLLTLVLALATAWGPVGATSLPVQAVQDSDWQEARKAVVEAVRSLT
ncbi:TetR family transcriptional regulator [Streptosporangium roseum]|uniref:TetR family transcriptional regulator n=1 Tax=Streptosporangium roseum TaxID=2001 RepID=UPI0033194C03